MSDIKFRAWERVSKNGSYIKVESIRFVDWIIVNGEYSNGVHCDLERFTGLKDKNGVEIYEGDIIGIEEEHEWGGDYRYPVEYEHNGFWLKGHDNEYGFGDTDEMEVIGNIHQHAHLLKKGEA